MTNKLIHTIINIILFIVIIRGIFQLHFHKIKEGFILRHFAVIFHGKCSFDHSEVDPADVH